MMQKSANWEEISGKDGKYRIGMLVYIGLYINSLAHAIFTMFTLNFFLAFFSFLHLINAMRKFGVKLIFRAVILQKVSEATLS